MTTHFDRVVSIVLLSAVLILLSAAVRAEPATTQSAHRFQLRLVAKDDDKDAAEDMPDPDHGGQPLRVLKHIEMDDRDLESAKPGGAFNNETRNVEIVFTDEGAKKFSELTGENLGRRLAFVFDGKVLCAPTINSRIGRKAVIDLGSKGTAADAKDLADTLNQIIDERGPTTVPAER